MLDWKPKKTQASSQRWMMIGGGVVVAVLLIVLLASTASVDSFLYLGQDVGPVVDEPGFYWFVENIPVLTVYVKMDEHGVLRRIDDVGLIRGAHPTVQ